MISRDFYYILKSDMLPNPVEVLGDLVEAHEANTSVELSYMGFCQMLTLLRQPHIRCEEYVCYEIYKESNYCVIQIIPEHYDKINAIYKMMAL